ncbi:MAG: octaprenyl diphosphate synthase, partial [Desulfuromonas sp.]
EGEVQQLINTCELSLDEDAYIEVVRNKTAVLLSAASRCGAVLGGVTDAEEEALAEFGMLVGIAFQFMDDALDYVADQADFGKARGHDLLEGKVTLPLIHTLSLCTSEERQQIEEIVEQEELPQSDLDEVIKLIERYDGIGYTRQRASEFVAEAKQCLSLFDDCEVRQGLFDLADYVIARNK